MQNSSTPSRTHRNKSPKLKKGILTQERTLIAQRNPKDYQKTCSREELINPRQKKPKNPADHNSLFYDRKSHHPLPFILPRRYATRKNCSKNSVYHSLDDIICSENLIWNLIYFFVFYYFSGSTWLTRSTQHSLLRLSYLPIVICVKCVALHRSCFSAK